MHKILLSLVLTAWMGLAWAATPKQVVLQVENMTCPACNITIEKALDAVEVLQWPAMTMAFKATPEQIASVRAGQKVQFEFTAEGMNATIIRVQSIQ